MVIREFNTGMAIDTISLVGGTETDSISFTNSVPLTIGSTYYIEIDSGAFVDFYGHTFAGIIWIG